MYVDYGFIMPFITRMMVNAPRLLLSICSRIPGQIELVRQRRKARANPIMKRTGNEAGSPWAIAKRRELTTIAQPRSILRCKPGKTKPRKNISSQKGATMTAAARIAYVVMGEDLLCASRTWSFVCRFKCKLVIIN